MHYRVKMKEARFLVIAPYLAPVDYTWRHNSFDAKVGRQSGPSKHWGPKQKVWVFLNDLKAKTEDRIEGSLVL